MGSPTVVPEDLASEISLQYFDNYILEIADRVLVDGTAVGRGSGASHFRIQGAVYSAYMDAAVCPLCAALDGMHVNVESDEFATLNPPQHRNCRCVWIYVEDGEAGWQADDDPWGRITDAAGGDVGLFVVRTAHENEALQDRFAEDVKRAREEILQRKINRAAQMPLWVDAPDVAKAAHAEEATPAAPAAPVVPVEPRTPITPSEVNIQERMDRPITKGNVVVGDRYLIAQGTKASSEGVVKNWVEFIVTAHHPEGGWEGRNDKTGRTIRVKSAVRLKKRLSINSTEHAAVMNADAAWADEQAKAKAERSAARAAMTPEEKQAKKDAFREALISERADLVEHFNSFGGRRLAEAQSRSDVDADAEKIMDRVDAIDAKLSPKEKVANTASGFTEEQWDKLPESYSAAGLRASEAEAAEDWHALVRERELMRQIEWTWDAFEGYNEAMPTVVEHDHTHAEDQPF